MAQCLIRPGCSPKRCPTLPTSLPATCSVKCLNGRHLSVDVATIDGLCCCVPPPYRVPARPEGGCRAFPSSISPPSLPSLALSLSTSAPCCSRRGRHGWPPSRHRAQPPPAPAAGCAKLAAVALPLGRWSHSLAGRSPRWPARRRPPTPDGGLSSYLLGLW